MYSSICIFRFYSAMKKYLHLSCFHTVIFTLKCFRSLNKYNDKYKMQLSYDFIYLRAKCKK